MGRRACRAPCPLRLPAALSRCTCPLHLPARLALAARAFARDVVSSRTRPPHHARLEPTAPATAPTPMLRLLPRPLLLLAALVLALPVGAVGLPGASVVTTPQVRAELVAHAPEGIEPGKPLWLGLLIEHQPQWHTYWKNPGDSGLPTTLAWSLPTELQAGELQWPTPKKLPVGPLMNYGYDGRLLLPVPVEVKAAPAGGAVRVELDAQWLACKEVCIPESGHFVLDLPAKASSAAHGTLFAAADAARPQALPEARASARVQDQALVFEVSGLPAAWQGRAVELLPETAGVVLNAAPVQASWKGAQWTARVALDPQRSESPQAMSLVLVAAGSEAGAQVTAAVTTPWPALAALPASTALDAPAAGADAAGPPPAIPAASSPGLLLALGLALLGGMLLNLMPCVFPVLSLKVLGFAAHADDRRGLLAGALAYTLGVVASFVALAALLLLLRAGGEQLGWGFQLQSPLFVAALAALFTLIGLNLAGVFEFGSILPARWSAARARHPLVDSLLTGVLAVAVASPCTAPFMGAALGAAVTLPTAQALAVFATLGLGMALPYLLASAMPALARALPRPGAWMAHFKVLMAFPMFATVVWLAWVLGQQSGIDGVAALLGALLALAFVAWALGSSTLGRRARLGLGTLALALALPVFGWAWPALHAEPASATTRHEAGWEAWSPERVAELRAAGRAVFVDFTAAWCVTCQYNKRTTLANAEVLAAFRARDVALLRADWTRRDPRITAELARLARSGVPVYALYAADGAPPRLLAEILRASEVKEALAALDEGARARTAALR